MQSGIVLYSMFTQPLLQLGLERVVSALKDCVYEGDMSDGATMDHRLRALQDSPESGKPILIVDYHPNDDELEQRIRALRSSFPKLGLLVFLPMLADEASVVRAMRWGAEGYLLHTATPEIVIRAIREIAQGRSFLQSQVTPIVLAEIRRPRAQAMAQSLAFELTDRDRMLLQLAADGLNNVQIADILGLAEKTVRNAWSQLFEKLGMTDRTQAVLWAIRSGQAELR
ncbi:LuxR C-terminal-related transcriptional regulator [Alicyclobacillus mengziensis]|uniref:Response regulator transcription factor n=1 Tax=Alicyclobacillus mengziensis TaxID=2931921 RepID=A0A9X7Z8D5_9BACL|nr:response regulator transcription factor [Alicyclobacillus mengziensis]QSO48168.1 response regulator transcription factor [Alicyclobacillus mengziensis]